MSLSLSPLFSGVRGGKTIWCAISGRPHGWRRPPFSLLSHGLSKPRRCPRSEGNARRGSHRFPSLRAIHREALLRDGNRPVASFRPKDDNGYSRAQCSSNAAEKCGLPYNRARAFGRFRQLWFRPRGVELGRFPPCAARASCPRGSAVTQVPPVRSWFPAVGAYCV